MIPHYHINVFWSAKQNCWFADVPDLPDCSASGASAEEAVTCIQQAMIDWVAAAERKGNSLPEPRYHSEAA